MAQVPEQLQNEVIEIRRVGRVTKGGKRMRFRVVVVVGNGAGRVGVGIGKSIEIPQAVQQAIRNALKNMIEIPIVNGTIPHEVRGEYGAAKVLLRPAYPGTGVIAGRTVGAICRMAGIKDILTKALRSTNPLNLARATLAALAQLESPEVVAKRRGKSVKELVEAENGAES
ncbi:MAG: 30S ribosomal protein S5 [Candidatus Bipolaricaulota bacterium]|nr:30S ribosomal protein S5 [Candidatus Bipolaricaulota bacterium]MDW8126291.1 30S ribosomal protein S5 [Candidatus Bipolaricaulota bacterium]